MDKKKILQSLVVFLMLIEMIKFVFNSNLIQLLLFAQGIYSSSLLVPNYRKHSNVKHVFGEA